MEQQNIYLFVHVILEVEDHKPLLKNILRVVYVAWLKKTMAEKGVRLHAINGGEDHVHMLLQLHPAQNLMQVVRQIKDESLSFIGSNHFSKESFAWKEGYTAFPLLHTESRSMPVPEREISFQPCLHDVLNPRQSDF
jgi:REP element-mobilizing transposase RayT